MTQTPTRAERIDLAAADDPRDVIHRVVACLAQGGVAGLPIETVYGLAASALNPEAVSRLARLKWADAPSDPSRPLAIFLKSAEEVRDWVPGITPSALRLASRAWPGPVTLVFGSGTDGGLGGRLPEPVRRLIGFPGALALRVPSHPLLREVLRLLPGPVILTRARGGKLGGPPASTPDELAEVDGVDMVVDDGPTELGAASTVVKVDGDAWSILRPGVVGHRDLVKMTGTIILFVCTGNTCRSPMAEAICRALLARRLGCPPSELDLRGYVIRSAGVAAMPGQPAASHAAEVVRARGGSLQDHVSRPVTAAMVRQADHILAMTSDHLDALLDHLPDAAPRARLLDPDGADLADPIGGDRETYLRTARTIESKLEHLFRELGLPDA